MTFGRPTGERFPPLDDDIAIGRVELHQERTAARLLADNTGSMVVDIWKDTYANYPPTASPDSITASAKPTLSSAIKSEDTTLTGWTTSISAGDTLRFNVDSCSGITRAVLVLTVTRTL